MADYEKNYYKLYNAVTDAIERLEAIQEEIEQEFINELPPPGEFKRHFSAIRPKNNKRYRIEKNLKKYIDN